MSERGGGGGLGDPPSGSGPRPEGQREWGERSGERREERWHGEGRREGSPWGSRHPSGPGRSGDRRGSGLRGRGRGFRQSPRQRPLTESLERALEPTGQRRGQVLCNAWTMRLEEEFQAWGYPLSIKERGTERPVGACGALAISRTLSTLSGHTSSWERPFLWLRR